MTSSGGSSRSSSPAAEEVTPSSGLIQQYAGSIMADPEVLQAVAKAIGTTLGNRLVHNEAENPKLQPTEENCDVLEDNCGSAGGRGRGKGKIYVVHDETFLTMSGAKDALDRLSGLAPEEKMWHVDDHYRKLTKAHVYKYRCSHSKKEKCPYTANIILLADGTHRIELPEPPHSLHNHDLHCAPQPASGRGLPCELREVVDRHNRSSVPTKQTLRELREDGLIDMVDKQLRDQIKNHKHSSKQKRSREDAVGESLEELRCFCIKTSHIPDDQNAVFCVIHDTEHSLFGFFSTPRLIKENCTGTSLALDYTYKRTWAGMPVALLANVDPPAKCRPVALGFCIEEDQRSVESLLRGVLHRAKQLGVDHSPKVFIADSAPSYTAAWEQVHGKVHPTKLDSNMEWVVADDATTLRIFCHFHMMTKATEHAKQFIKPEGVDAKREAERDIEEFIDDVRTLQRSPTHALFSTGAKLFMSKWSSRYPELATYFSNNWLHQRCTWSQTCYENIAPPPFPRTNNHIEATNKSFKDGLIHPGTDISTLVRELIAATADFSIRHEETCQPNSMHQRLLAAAKWCNSPEVKDIYISDDDSCYFIPSLALTRWCANRQELDDTMASFIREYFSAPGGSWDDFDEYSIMIRNVTIVRRDPHRCSCYENRVGDGECKHARKDITINTKT
ncbi:hypothetical protein FOL46_000945 [Perkinsus olseni]|uniref:SWIM-type domain-containing protein n=1 Tax=Perkinsus olseni TaxID=32597 RepID=A0A7J6KT19_PEROL|nr:hypothetical protein FOL46_000945 [Perkinsus olseni]